MLSTPPGLIIHEFPIKDVSNVDTSACVPIYSGSGRLLNVLGGRHFGHIMRDRNLIKSIVPVDEEPDNAVEVHDLDQEVPHAVSLFADNSLARLYREHVLLSERDWIRSWEA